MLTHWSWEIWTKFLLSHFQVNFSDWSLRCISFEIVHRGMSLDLTYDKSTLVQVMAWCREATSHYRSQCWPRSLSSYGVTRPHWVNIYWHFISFVKADKLITNDVVNDIAICPDDTRSQGISTHGIVVVYTKYSVTHKGNLNNPNPLPVVLNFFLLTMTNGSEQQVNNKETILKPFPSTTQREMFC